MQIWSGEWSFTENIMTTLEIVTYRNCGFFESKISFSYTFFHHLSRNMRKVLIMENIIIVQVNQF